MVSRVVNVSEPKMPSASSLARELTLETRPLRFVHLLLNIRVYVFKFYV